MINISKLKTLLFIAAIIASLVFGKIYWGADARETRELLKENRQMKVQIVDLTLKNGKQAQQIHTLTVSRKNREIMLEQYQKELKAHNIKPKNVQSLLNISVKGKGSVSNQAVTNYTVRDSILLKDSFILLYDTIRTWAFSDSLLNMTCGSVNDSISCDYTVSLSMIAIAHRERFKLFVVRTWRKKNRKEWLNVQFNSSKVKATEIEFIRARD